MAQERSPIASFAPDPTLNITCEEFSAITVKSDSDSEVCVVCHILRRSAAGSTDRDRKILVFPTKLDRELNEEHNALPPLW